MFGRRSEKRRRSDAPPDDGPAIDEVEPEPGFWRRAVRALRVGRGRPLGLVVLLTALAVVVGPESRPVRVIRLALFDSYQFRLPRERVSAPVVIVDVDEASLAAHGQWPWPRTLLARLIARIGEGHPAAIGLDVIMPEPDRLSPERLAPLVAGVDADLAARLGRLPENDRALARTLADLPVVLGVAGVDDPAGPAGPPRLRTPARIHGADPGPLVRRFRSELRSVEVIDAAAAGHGLISIDVEGGIVRSVPAVAAIAGGLVPTLGLEMLRVAAGEPAFSVVAGPTGVEAVVVGDLAVPTQPDGSVLIRYSRHDPARFVSAVDVLSGQFDVRQFDKKLVVVGVTAVGLADDQATPVGDRRLGTNDRMSGPEIHAQLIEGIFEGDLLSRPWWAVWAEGAFMAVAGVLLILAVPRLPVLASAGLAIGLVVVAAALAVGAYAGWRLLLDASVPVLGLGGVFTAMLGVTLGEAESQRRALRRQVARQREEAARLAGELEAARRIQMGSLPSAAAFAGERRLDLYAFLDPAREVGGDLYDFFRLDGDRVFLLVGDVSGKGLPGCLLMAVSKSLFKSIALRRAGDVGAVMREADREIARDNAESLFVTVWAAILDVKTGELEYGNAGHDAPYLLSRGGGPARRLAEGGGPPLSTLDDFPHGAARYQMARGELLCLVTDGVVEATSPDGEFYGRARLEALLAAMAPGAAPDEVGEAIRRDAARFAGEVDRADDVAILIVRWNGPAGRP